MQNKETEDKVSRCFLPLLYQKGAGVCNNLLFPVRTSRHFYVSMGFAPITKYFLLHTFDQFCLQSGKFFQSDFVIINRGRNIHSFPYFYF